MWAKPILKRNIGILESVGYRIVPPETGIQASGESGEGRMASINGIIAALCEMTKIISEEEKG
jgi:phosphopantothenoylcysteine synthetase/decarboxylase